MKLDSIKYTGLDQNEGIIRYEYYKRLVDVSRAPIENPTREQIQALCPHLFEKDIEKIFNQAEAKGESRFAMPPVRVNDGYHVAVLTKSFEVQRDTYPMAFGLASSYEIYIEKKEFPYAKEAVEFARNNWSDQLIEDTWYNNGFFKVSLYEPIIDMSGENVSPIKQTFYACLSRDFASLLNDRSAPTNELIHESIVRFTDSFVLGCELRAQRFTNRCSNCAYCGGGIAKSTCVSCGKFFKIGQPNWYVPLPNELVLYAKSQGHQFGIDPSIAQKVQQKK